MKSIGRSAQGVGLRLRSLLATQAPCFIEALEQRRLFSLPFGVIDTSFGVGGHALLPGFRGVNLPLYAYQVVVGPDGSVYIGGSDGIGHFTASGAVDQSFGYSGIRSRPFDTNFVAEAVTRSRACTCWLIPNIPTPTRARSR